MFFAPFTIFFYFYFIRIVCLIFFCAVFSLLYYLGYTAGTYSSSTFSYCKSKSFFHGYRYNKLYFHFCVVSWHYHLHTFWKCNITCYICCSKVKLGTVSCKEWG